MLGLPCQVFPLVPEADITSKKVGLATSDQAQHAAARNGLPLMPWRKMNHPIRLEASAREEKETFSESKSCGGDQQRPELVMFRDSSVLCMDILSDSKTTYAF